MKDVMKIVTNILLMSIFLCGIVTSSASGDPSATATAGASASSYNEMNMTSVDAWSQYFESHPYPTDFTSVDEFRTHMLPMGLPMTDLPPYFGPMPKAWNDMSGTVLPFLLASQSEWSASQARSMRNRDVKSASTNIIAIAKAEKEKLFFVKVVNGYKQLLKKKIEYFVVGIVAPHGGTKETTIDCFSRAIKDSCKMGANVLVLLKASSTPAIYSKTIGLGSSGSQGFIRGSNSYTGGQALGFASNKGYPESRTFIHGVAIQVEKKDYEKLTSDGDMLNNNNNGRTERTSGEKYTGSKK